VLTKRAHLTEPQAFGLGKTAIKNYSVVAELKYISDRLKERLLIFLSFFGQRVAMGFNSHRKYCGHR